MDVFRGFHYTISGHIMKIMAPLSVKIASNLGEKIQGLIGKEKPYRLMLKTRFGIHTFGVKFPIDILILDKENKVAVMKKNLKPNRIFLWNPKYDKVIELPSGDISKRAIKIKDKIDLLCQT